MMIEANLLLVLTHRIVGNPLLCGANSANNCSTISPEPLSFPPDALRGSYHRS